MSDGRKIPWWEKKGLLNPMKSSHIAHKVSTTLRNRIKKDPLLAYKMVRKKGCEGRPRTDEEKRAASVRMKKNNPMKSTTIARKMGASLKARLDKDKQNGTPHPNLGRKRPDVVQRMKKNNPMKNSKIASKVFKKGMKTLLRKGMLSEGQLRLYAILECSDLKYEKGEYFIFKKPNIRGAFPDAFLPDFNIVIEYDGFSGHETKEGIKHDQLRDKYFQKLYGISTIRMGRNSIFAKGIHKTLMRAINEIKMEKGAICRRIG